MAVLGIDLGGTKITFAVFSIKGEMLSERTILLNGLKGAEIGALITKQISVYQAMASAPGLVIESIGVSVPGIFNKDTGMVWAPNIEDWQNYPLLDELQVANPQIPAIIDNDRACYILGEKWQGTASNCTDAIYLSIGTGIGAGIITNGNVLRGSAGIAGAMGWLTFAAPFKEAYKTCGYFESYASGNGIVSFAKQLVKEHPEYTGELKGISTMITSQDVFKAFENHDPIAMEVIEYCIGLWGMAVANLVSLFNPEKIIMGGGVFGPAIKFLPMIKETAAKWAQPISAAQYSLEASVLGSHAGVYGAGFLALQNLLPSQPKNNYV